MTIVIRRAPEWFWGIREPWILILRSYEANNTKDSDKNMNIRYLKKNGLGGKTIMISARAGEESISDQLEFLKGYIIRLKMDIFKAEF